MRGPRILQAGIVLLALFMIGAVYADENTARKLAAELLRLDQSQKSVDQALAAQKQALKVIFEKQRQQALRGLPTPTKAQIKTMTATEQKVTDMITGSMSWDKIKADVINAYAATFTEAEMKAAIAFYKTPEGKKFAEKHPVVAQKLVMVLQKRFQAIIPKIQGEINSSIKALGPAKPDNK
ncbi:DUF2059 domain-containing protein [Thermodesulfobacteriota bacterium]